MMGRSKKEHVSMRLVVYEKCLGSATAATPFTSSLPYLSFPLRYDSALAVYEKCLASTVSASTCHPLPPPCPFALPSPPAPHV